MDIVLLLIFILLFVNIQFKTERDDYMDKKQTTNINGFFLLIVFAIHYNQYVELNSELDRVFLLFCEKICQLLVTTFLFYSGYGVFRSIQSKGESYVKSMPVNRILKTFMSFGSAIILYILINMIIGESLEFNEILLALIGWISIGNSNWYIFAILVMYILTWLSFRINIKKSQFYSIFLNSILVCVYVILIMNFKEGRFYNTVLCYILGMWYGFFKTNIDRILKKKSVYIGVTGLSIVMFIFTYINKDANLVFNQLMYLLFVLCIVLVTMKVVIGNCVLSWCGIHLMPLFILQRMPMLIFREYNLFTNRPYIFFCLSLLITVILAWIFDKTILELVEKFITKIQHKRVNKITNN